MNDYLRLLGALSSTGVEFIVVGGTAAVLHGSATATYDLDVLMPFTRINCERLLSAVAPLHPRLAHPPDKRPLQLSADQLTAFKNLDLQTELGRLDVLGSLPPVEDVPGIFDRSIRMDVGGVDVRVVSLEELIRVCRSVPLRASPVGTRGEGPARIEGRAGRTGSRAHVR